MKKNSIFKILSLCLALIFIVSTINCFAQTSSSPFDNQSQTAPLKSPREILKFLNVNAKKLGPKKVDSYVLRLISLQSQRQKSYETQLYSRALNSKINSYQLQDLVKYDSIKDQTVKNLVYQIYADGMRLYSAEGMIGLEKDFPKLARSFAKFSSSQVSGYLYIMARETNKHFAVDAALTLTPDELAYRIVKVEKFTAGNPRFPRIGEIRQLYRNYLTAYLIGLNNTPAFSYQNNKLEKAFFLSYQHSVRKYHGTQFANLIKNYLLILEKNDWQRTKVILDFVAVKVN